MPTHTSAPGEHAWYPDTGFMATSRLLRDVTFFTAAVTSSGSVTVPDHGVRSPGVVVVGGSGPSDRDNDTHFPPIRRHLAGDATAALDFLRAAARHDVPRVIANGCAGMTPARQDR